MYEWLIIGGGVHATTIALQLRYLGLPAKQLRIVDPNHALMENFKMQTTRLSMPYLRSPLVHHCHPEPFDLKKFAKKHQYTQAMMGHYQRPRLDMFFDHTDYWIQRYDLSSCHIQQRASDIAYRDGHWHVRLDNDTLLTAQHVILAMGTHHTPYIPDMYVNQPDVQHIHQPDFNTQTTASHVVGSGISAAHLVLKLLAEQRSTPIHLWLKKPLEVFDFDADPGWLGPKNLRGFHCEEDLKQRIAINRHERHKGSMPKEMYMKLMRAEKEECLMIHQTPVDALEAHTIVSDGKKVVYDGIYLATGFKIDLMQQPLIQSLVQRHGAKLVEGFPVINTSLEWLPKLFVSGMLADLELGPFARNIMGGRMAAQRIGEVYRQAQDNIKKVI
ncbi:lysine N(6)-hydroxylase/L-ornithine N(5)-oxygenase family protein [Staphylococcus americanisciuri]|uniref:L-lysine N6-monooxygenase MbtG n=1 Tax=Staphylococcus americanisciuri TaxID=2973940 RepID=A0ABT2F3K8_9STAP|nr:lysine N(6)-hydroxylase/L-ornithine N(5)-oxygenase family protein [Staphylococcus americanisciuri]MCS4487073.1 lysine N(6)-hydroxylase/L-ornithine N(5)-oxygenase family protein [Staphylococcus americanisciuri]